MELKAGPLQLDELEEFSTIMWQAFSPPEADMISPMIFTQGLTPDLRERYKTRMIDATEGNPGQTVHCVRDTKTNEIVAVSWWMLEKDPPKTEEELENKYQENQAKRRLQPQLEGQNMALNNAMFETAYRIPYEVIGPGVPYATLIILATRPGHQGHGAGTMLIKYGLEKVDAMGLPVDIIAGKAARPLYERLGFKTIKEFPLDCREYGGRSKGEHFIMMRPAVARS